MSSLSFLRCIPAILAASVPLAWPMASFGQANMTVPGLSLTYTNSGGKVDALPRITKQAFFDAWGGVFEMDSPNGQVRAKGPVPARVGGAAGPTVNMTAARGIGLPAVARAAARAIPAVATGMAIATIADEIRCRSIGSVTVFGHDLECDEGQDPALTEIWQYGAVGTVLDAVVDTRWQDSYQAACDAALGPINAVQGPKGAYVTVLLATETSCVFGRYSSSTGNLLQQAGLPVGKQLGQSEACQGGATPGPDGKCPTGVYQPKTFDWVGNRIEQHPSFQQGADAVADEAVRRGADLTDDAGPASLSGPGTATGPTTTTTTTGPNGTTVTTNTTNYDITYEGDSFTWNTSTTTTDGETTTTTDGQPREDVECGLPGMPKCQIDESGTPVTGGIAEWEAARTAADDREAAIAQAGEQQSLGWEFGLILPSAACTPLTWEVKGHTVLHADPCNSEGVALYRLLAAWALGMWAALYTWRSFTGAMEAS